MWTSEMTPLGIWVFSAALGFGLFLILMTTSYVKMVVVLGILRNALSLQQAPSNMVLNTIAIALSMFVMSPVIAEVQSLVRSGQIRIGTFQETFDSLQVASVPILQFVERNTGRETVQSFENLRYRQHVRFPSLSASVDPSEPLAWNYALPAFLISELKDSFRVGVLLFLPFVIIDIIVSNVLISLGMMMMSPATISLPIKLILFLVVDGWSRVCELLIMSYR